MSDTYLPVSVCTLSLNQRMLSLIGRSGTCEVATRFWYNEEAGLSD